MALSSRSGLKPQPSRMHSTAGRGRESDDAAGDMKNQLSNVRPTIGIPVRPVSVLIFLLHGGFSRGPEPSATLYTSEIQNAAGCAPQSAPPRWSPGAKKFPRAFFRMPTCSAQHADGSRTSIQEFLSLSSFAPSRPIAFQIEMHRGVCRAANIHRL